MINNNEHQSTVKRLPLMLLMTTTTTTTTGMSDRLRAGRPPRYFTNPSRQTQPLILNWTGNQS